MDNNRQQGSSLRFGTEVASGVFKTCITRCPDQFETDKKGKLSL